MWAPESAWITKGGEESCPYRDSSSDPSAVQPVATALSRLRFQQVGFKSVAATLELTRSVKTCLRDNRQLTFLLAILQNRKGSTAGSTQAVCFFIVCGRSEIPSRKRFSCSELIEATRSKQHRWCSFHRLL
jgi:hypothetical protein